MNLNVNNIFSWWGSCLENLYILRYNSKYTFGIIPKKFLFIGVIIRASHWLPTSKIPHHHSFPSSTTFTNTNITTLRLLVPTSTYHYHLSSWEVPVFFLRVVNFKRRVGCPRCPPSGFSSPSTTFTDHRRQSNPTWVG